MRLYHGSKSGIVGALAPKSRSCCDFGQGFCLHIEANELAVEDLKAAARNPDRLTRWTS